MWELSAKVFLEGILLRYGIEQTTIKLSVSVKHNNIELVSDSFEGIDNWN